MAGNQQGETQEWCSTLTDSNGLHVGGQGNWGWCPSDCNGISPPPPTTTFPPAAPCSRILNSIRNPEENGDHFEGDIIIGDSKVFTNNRNSRWPNGVVPFVIEGSFGKDINCLPTQHFPFIENLDTGQSARDRIEQAASDFNTRTGGCVRWVPRSSEANYVAIINSASGCWSYVGRTLGRQELNLASGCTGSGTIEHEMLHALGTWHEQSRPDR